MHFTVLRLHSDVNPRPDIIPLRFYAHHNQQKLQEPEIKRDKFDALCYAPVCNA